jgi:16S rRNA (cytosine1402-N4)-methyltransferase
VVTQVYHNPVLLSESIEALNILPTGNYVDATFGGGGHSAAILNKLEGGKLFAFDQDPDALANVPKHNGFVLFQSNFRYLKNYLKLQKALPVNGILADLGISSHQIDTPERGFATRFDARLDMRMDKAKPISAYEVVNNYEQDKLADVIFQYGELRNARQLAKLIVEKRADGPIETTGQLLATVKKVMPGQYADKFSAMLFQALRIEVNEELEVLKEFLSQTPEVLATGGRLVVISYHSLEDRLVKNFLKSGNFEGKIEKDFFGNPNVPFKVLKKVTATDAEVKQNPRARSAVMRIAEKL